MKTTLKGLLLNAGKIETFTTEDKEKNKRTTRVLTLMVLEPGRTDEFGEKVGFDQKHQIKVINKNIDKLPANLIKSCTEGPINLEPNTKVSLNLFIQSRQFTTKEGIEQSAADLVLSDIEILN